MAVAALFIFRNSFLLERSPEKNYFELFVFPTFTELPALSLAHSTEAKHLVALTHVKSGLWPDNDLLPPDAYLC
jgi:hypothetical protein